MSCLGSQLLDFHYNVTGIDASEFERTYTSAHYTSRTDLTIQQLKMVLFVDTVSNAVVDIHVIITRNHDAQIAPRVVKRSAESITALIRGCDDQKLQQSAGVRYLTTHQAS